MDLDNGIAVTETDMTVRRPQKSEHGDAAEIPGQAYKNRIGRTAQTTKQTYQLKRKKVKTHEQDSTD